MVQSSEKIVFVDFDVPTSESDLHGGDEVQGDAVCSSEGGTVATVHRLAVGLHAATLGPPVEQRPGQMTRPHDADGETHGG
jgi:hypothetical protein